MIVILCIVVIMINYIRAAALLGFSGGTACLALLVLTHLFDPTDSGGARALERRVPTLKGIDKTQSIKNCSK